MAVQKYTGYKDSLIDFNNDAIDFNSQNKFDKIFKVTVINSGTSDQVVILNPSRKPSSPLRVIKDGVIAYTSGATDLNSTGYPNTIAELLAYLVEKPTRVVSLKIQSTNSAQLSQALTFTYRDVFATPGSERINLDKYTSEFAQNDKLITVTKEFQLDNDTELSIVVPAAMSSSNPTQTVFTFVFGASIDVAGSLKRKRTMSL